MKKEKGSASYKELMEWYEEDLLEYEEEVAQDFLKSKVIRKVIAKMVTGRLKAVIEENDYNYLDTYLRVTDDGEFLFSTRLSLGAGLADFREVRPLLSFFEEFIEDRDGEDVKRFVSRIRQIADDIERRYPANSNLTGDDGR